MLSLENHRASAFLQHKQSERWVIPDPDLGGISYRAVQLKVANRKEHEPAMPLVCEFMQRLSALARLLRAEREGVAAVEFAMIVPLMMFLFIGVVEMSYAMIVYGRVQHKF